MILNRPKTDIKILEALLSGENLTANEIKEEARTSVSRVRANLKGLLNDRLVLSFRNHPKHHLYRINLWNLSALKFAELFYAEKYLEINKKLPVLQSTAAYASNVLGDELFLIILFGSSIKEKRFNDIDICLIMTDDTNEMLKKAKDVTDKIQEMFTSYTFSTQVFSLKVFNELVMKEDQLARNILNGIPLASQFNPSLRPSDFLVFTQRFVELKLLSHFQDVRGPIVKALELVKKYAKNNDQNLLEDAKKNFIYGILRKHGIIPENIHEANKLLQREFAPLNRKIDIVFKSKNAKKIIIMMIEEGV